MHARSGGNIEVMGMMQGFITEKTFIVMDAFALPVEASETQVVAQQEAFTYMIAHTEMEEQVGRSERVCGWYHSHPGYGAWLSGTDVKTQSQNQIPLYEPWLAIVVDPVRTIASGKVEIGAFRTYPEGYTPPDEGPSEYQTVPMDKIEDFGVHCKRYYPLDISVFKSTSDVKLLDLLWSKYWAGALSSSPTLTNLSYFSGQVNDLSSKLDQAETHLGHSGRSSMMHLDTKKEESQLAKATKDSSKTATQQINGIVTQVLKHVLFNPQN